MSMFSDRRGKTSVDRVVFFMWSVAVIGLWAYVSIRKDELVALPETIAAVVGASFAAKVGHRYVENRDGRRDPPPVAPPPPRPPPPPVPPPDLPPEP